jgi:hypothetical protein
MRVSYLAGSCVIGIYHWALSSNWYTSCNIILLKWQPKQKCTFEFTHQIVQTRGPGSVVGIATGYGLDRPGIESRWGRDFSHLSRPTLSVHPVSCTMGTASFPEPKSGQGVTLTPHILLVSLVELYLYSPYEAYGLYRASVPVQECTSFFLVQTQDTRWKIVS